MEDFWGFEVGSTITGEQLNQKKLRLFQILEKDVDGEIVADVYPADQVLENVYLGPHLRAVIVSNDAQVVVGRFTSGQAQSKPAKKCLCTNLIRLRCFAITSAC